MPLNGWPPCLSGRSFSEGWCSHVPNRGEQMVRYYGYYSNLCRGKREKQNKDDVIPCILEPSGSSKARPGATRIPIYFKRSIMQCLIFRLWSPFIGLGQGIQKKLGQVDSKDIWSRSTHMSEMFRGDEGDKCYRGWGSHKKDPQTPWAVGSESQVSYQSNRAAEAPQTHLRLFHLPASCFR